MERTRNPRKQTRKINCHPLHLQELCDLDYHLEEDFSMYVNMQCLGRSGQHSLFSVHALFLQIFGRLFTGSFCNENAKFTQSLLCSRFIKFLGACNHSHVHSLFAANGSSECSSIHVSAGDYQHWRKSLETKRQTDLRKGRRLMMRCKGVIPITNHANDHYSISSIHNERFTNHSNHMHTHIFTPIPRAVATKVWTMLLSAPQWLQIKFLTD